MQMFWLGYFFGALFSISGCAIGLFLFLRKTL
jgi:hypothetical protein